MTRLRLCLASLLLASTIGACATSAAADRLTPAPIARTSTSIDRAKLRAKLAERRAITIERFLAYREARVYPMANLPGGGFRHVWVDSAGNLCAAATLISLDWGREVALRVGAANGEIKLADAKGTLADWILTSGMTRAELVAIQLPGFQIEPREDLRQQELTRMYQIYLDVERQIRSLQDANLDLAVDALMKRPDLAREVLGGGIAGPGEFAKVPVG